MTFVDILCGLILTMVGCFFGNLEGYIPYVSPVCHLMDPSARHKSLNNHYILRCVWLQQREVETGLERAGAEQTGGREDVAEGEGQVAAGQGVVSPMDHAKGGPGGEEGREAQG